MTPYVDDYCLKTAINMAGVIDFTKFCVCKWTDLKQNPAINLF